MYQDVSEPYGTVPVQADEQSRLAFSTDFGRIVRKKPRSIVTPRTAQEVIRIVEHARRVQSPLAMRGAAHSQSGQSLTDRGIVLHLGSLNGIGAIERDTVRVGAGVRWRDLVTRVLAGGYLPMVLTNNLDVTVGGTISAGGVGTSSHLFGAQVDNVEDLDVVTGAGRAVRCSPSEHSALFDAVRCGLGQCAVITAARLRLRRVAPSVRTFFLLYDDLGTLMKDQESVISAGRFTYVESCCVPPDARFRPAAAGATQHARWYYPMRVAVEFEQEPDDGELLAGLRFSCCRRSADYSITEFIELAHPRLSHARRTMVWNMAHPWIDTFLPWRTAASCIEQVLNDVADELPQGCPLLLAPLRSDRFAAPLLIRPAGRFVMGFWVLQEVPPTALPQVLPVMERVSRRLTDCGGKRYLSGWLAYDRDQWRSHFGDRWAQLLEWKERFDPAGILNPGFIRYRPSP